jgi:acyl-coenzyme A thioesterase PaaI-like protein
VPADQRSNPGVDAALFRCEADPASPAWVRWSLDDKTRFNGQFGDFQTRRDGDRAIVRMQPHAALGNMSGNVHGGAVMTFIDMAMFVGAEVLGVKALRGVTVDLNVQFVGGGDLVRPIDTVIQITRETGRLLFIRGTVEQAGDMVASYIGILRKPSA